MLCEIPKFLMDATRGLVLTLQVSALVSVSLAWSSLGFSCDLFPVYTSRTVGRVRAIFH